MESKAVFFSVAQMLIKLHSGKLTGENGPFEVMYFLNMGIFHCYVISQEGGFCSWPLHIILFLPSGGKNHMNSFQWDS